MTPVEAARQLKPEEWKFITIDAMRWDRKPDRRDYKPSEIIAVSRPAEAIAGFINSMDTDDRMHLLEVCETSAEEK